MKKKHLILLFSFIFVQVAFSFDKEEVDRIVNLYKNDLSFCFKDESQFIEKQFEIQDFFKDVNIHNYDLFGDELPDITIETYLRLLYENYNFDIQISFGETYVYDCSYYNKVAGKNYAVAVFDKELLYKGKKKNLSFLLMLDISSRPYKIENAFIKEIHPGIQLSCSVDSEEDKLQQLKRTYEKEYLEKAQSFHRVENYIKAKYFYQEVLKLNSDNKIAQEGVVDCDVIVASMVIAEIDKLIELKNYILAKQRLITLSIEAKYGYDKAWFETSFKKCERGIRIQKANNRIKLADYYFDKKMFTVAKKNYKTALHFEYKTGYINKQLEACKLGDPNFVKNQIQEAYYEALATKKNYLKTFKTYVKYESSGLLTGENYYFLCLMMLGDKKVAKGMGYSKSLSKSLAREYFYKARRKGCNKCDISFLENQVFTSNINRKQ
jgi:hypothetical protein